ncbi:MAG: response regulator [Chitinophagaceae bacterium]|nr:response regulator [Chitinophagaceae bacterium]
MAILIAERNDLINDRLKNLVSEACNWLAIYQAKSYNEAIMLFRQHKPSTVILDTEFPGNKSVELLKDVKTANRGIVVIVITIQTDAHTRKKYVLADYFFDKYHEFEKIIDIIKFNSKMS